MRKPEFEKVAQIILKLPPGSSLSVAYKVAKNIDAIPKDPLSPSSAARGLTAVSVFPILDLKGALPGQYNQYVL